ncbi:MAG: hypothetical protein HUJ99_07805 [Bacteroidaceae bacterium]|nr:hypothetical protein [Bacteroidaceae bacterium]
MSETLEYGDVNTPVCWYAYTGKDPQGLYGEEAFSNVAPCKYPWQTPCGVISERDEDDDGVTVTMDGGFWIKETNLLPSLPESSDPNAFFGRRVYFDQDCYVADTYCTLLDDHSATRPVRGIYPGGATVGYVANTRVNEDDKREYYIKIDPRPATADYVIIQKDYGINENDRFKCIEVTSYTNTGGVLCTGASTRVDGVVCGTFPSVDANHESSPAPQVPVVVCNHGPSWVRLSGDSIYSMESKDYLSRRFSPHSIPVSCIGEFALQPTKTVPIVGDVISWERWWDGEVVENTGNCALVNVNIRKFA